MKTLPINLRKNGCSYTQLQKGKRSYVYEQRGTADRIIGYEVFLRRVKPEREVFGKVLPESEVFPNNEAFGLWAWSRYTLKSATEKFIELESNI